MILKTRTAIEFARHVRLFLNVEAGITGVEVLARKLTSHPKAKMALSELEGRPVTARLAALLRNGATAQPSPPTPLGNGASQALTSSPGEGNSAQVQRLAKRNQKLKQELAQARSAIQPPSFHREATRVFFVVGLGKSGTSWLMRILDGHPEILCKGEGRFFGREWRRSNFKITQKPVLASSFYNALLNSEYLRLWIERSVWTNGGDPDEQLARLAHVAVNLFLTEALAKTDKKIVGDKTPLLSPEFVEEIHLIYPEARVIHIIRDGRDSAVSMMHHLWNRSSDKGGVQTLTPEEVKKREAYRANPQKVLETSQGIFTEERFRQTAESWRLRVGKTIEIGPALFGENYTEVYYEDLLERPHEEVRRLAAFLGAADDDAAIEQAVSGASFEKLSKGRERGQEDSSSFFRKGVSGDWKNYFTERNKEIYKEEAGELLIRLGYEKDYSW